MTLLSTAPTSATDLSASTLIDAAADEAASSLSPEIRKPAKPSRSGAVAKPWKRRDHLGGFRLYITPSARADFPLKVDSLNYDTRGRQSKRRVKRIPIHVLKLRRSVAPLIGYDWIASPVRQRGYVRRDAAYKRVLSYISEKSKPPIVDDATEWLPGRLQKFPTSPTTSRRWYLPLHKGARPFAPVRYPKPDPWMPPYRQPEHVEPDDVLGDLKTLSRLASNAKKGKEGDRAIWQRRARAWKWWRDFRYPNAGSDLSYYDDGDKRDEDRLMYIAPDIGELMRGAGWSGSEKTGWNTRLAEQPLLSHVGEGRDRAWRITVGDLVFCAFFEWGYKPGDRGHVGVWASFPKVGLRTFGTTKKGRTLYPRERLRQHQPATWSPDGRKHQKRWDAELRSYLGLSGVAPYYAEPHQRMPIRPPHTPTNINGEPCHIDYEPCPALLPERPPAGKVRGGRFGVEAARAYLEMIGVDGSVSLAEARANAGLPPLPVKQAQDHAEQYAGFTARLDRYRAGENIRLVEPCDLGDAMILGVGKDGSVDTKVWRGGIMNPVATKAARIEPDGWAVAAMSRTKEEDTIRVIASNDIDRGGHKDVSEMEDPDLLEAIGANAVTALDMCIGDAAASEIAEKVFGLEPTYAAAAGAKRVDNTLDTLAEYLWPITKKPRTIVPANDNLRKHEKKAA